MSRTQTPAKSLADAKSYEKEAISDMLRAKDIKSINDALQKFRLSADAYNRINNYEKVGACYDKMGKGYEKSAELCNSGSCDKAADFYHEKAAKIFNDSAVVYKNAKEYKKSAEMFNKSAESYGKVAEIFRNIKNTSNDPDITTSLHGALKKAMAASTNAFEMQKGLHNMWRPTFRGWKGASPRGYTPSKNNRSDPMPPPTRRRRTRRA